MKDIAMLNEELFYALKQIGENSNGSNCIVKPKSNDPEIINAFNQLVLCAYRLRELGYIDFTEKQVLKNYRYSSIRYDMLICQLKYQATQILKFDSFHSYIESDLYKSNSNTTLIDQSVKIGGNIVGSNFSAHSTDIQQSVLSNDAERIIQEIIDVLQEDKSLSDTEQKELINDANTLSAELKRNKPRSQLIGSLYNSLANTASIASLVVQLAPFLPMIL